MGLFTVLAEVAQSHSSKSSLPDLIGEQNGGADCPCEDDEEMPPLEGDDATDLQIEENWKLVQQQVYTKV